MQTKVEICGVNTSGLPVLSAKKTDELLRRSSKGDKQARDELIQGNLRLVLSVVQRFQGRGESPDDLFQVGCIGLIKAIDHFDLSQEVRFSTYAVPMIIGEVRRFLRDYAPVRVSRSLKDLAYQAMQAKEQLTASLGREPTILEIAKQVGQSKIDVVLALESIVDPVSLYEPVYSDGGEPICVMDQIAGGSTDGDWIDEMAIRDALEELSDREKRIIGLRFFEGKSQMEVSSEIGISQAQVSRLEKGALQKVQLALHD